MNQGEKGEKGVIGENGIGDGTLLISFGAQSRMDMNYLRADDASLQERNKMKMI